MKTRHGLLLPLLVLISFASSGSGQEWTRFRGPNGLGISHCKTIPTKWTEKDFQWKIELPGTGHSSPVVWGERVFITSAEPVAPGEFHALCFNAVNGSKLWQRDFPLSPFQKNALNSFASATPAVDAERVYMSWGTPEHFMLAAFDHAGKTVWERDLGT
ncbi:MAG: PQQ-binding-like beta-propeller repeat protein, partial [Verrucomicrobiia bacterium]